MLGKAVRARDADAGTGKKDLNNTPAVFRAQRANYLLLIMAGRSLAAFGHDCLKRDRVRGGLPTTTTRSVSDEVSMPDSAPNHPPT